MLADQIRRAIPATPKAKLADLSAALWKAYGAGLVPEDEAQALAEAIQARRAIPAAPTQPRRVGSRPRAPESLERRRRWVSSGWMPPQLACRFTPGEAAALAVVAAQAAKHGRCDLALDHIAALAGVGRTTVRNAIAEARRIGLVTVELRPRRAFRSDTNVVRIVASAWQSWISMRRSAPGQGVGAKPCAPRDTDIFSEKKRALSRALAGRLDEEDYRERLQVGTRKSRLRVEQNATFQRCF